MALKREEVYKLIDGERDYQENRWNCKTTTCCGKHTVGEFIIFMEDYLREAKHVLSRREEPSASEAASDILRKVTSMGVACMEQNGAPART